MENFIYQNNKTDNQINNEELFTVIGLEDFIDKDGFPRANETNKNVVAKKIPKQNTYKYMIKIGLNNKLTNPISIYGSEKQSSFLDTVCRSNNKFIEVNSKTFFMYLNFLKTKNLSWLFNAERELT